MTEPPLMSDGSERVTRRRAVASLVVHGRDEHAGVLKRHQHSIPLFQCEVISPSAVEPNHPQAGAVFLCSVADLWPRRSRPVIAVELDVSEFDDDVRHVETLAELTLGSTTRILSPSAYVAWESEEPELSEQGGRVAPEEKRCEGEDNHLPNSATNAVDPLLSFFVWLHGHGRIMRALDADGQPLGLFDEKQAAVEAIVSAAST